MRGPQLTSRAPQERVSGQDAADPLGSLQTNPAHDWVALGFGLAGVLMPEPTKSVNEAPLDANYFGTGIGTRHML